jgi:hypothetical protein
MTVTFLVTILIFGLVFILMSIKVILKRDEFTLTCSNGFGDDIDTSLCGNRGEECCQSGERNGNNSIGQL